MIFTKKTRLLSALLITVSFNLSAAMTDHFVTTWNTRIAANNTQNSIEIPTNSSYQYSYDVDWDNDGIFDDFGVTSNIMHDYESPGVKTIRIQGQFPAIQASFNNGTNIYSIEQWGTYPWQTMNFAFADAYNLVNNASDTPNLSECTDLSFMFIGASNIGDISETSNWNWNTFSITNMRGFFSGATVFNQDISMWDTSNVTSMQALFSNAKSFDKHIGNWNTSKVIDMSGLFSNAESFDQDISMWDTSNVTSMHALFSNAKTFDKHIGNWNTSKVIDMSRLFSNAESFNQDISNWNTEKVEFMGSMFFSAESFNQDIGNWDTKRVTVFTSMFQSATLFNQDISSWDTSNATYLAYMFNQAESFNQDISSWDTSNATHFNYMFQKALLFNQDLSQWNVENAIEMTEMFRYLTLSVENYDALLVEWGSQNLQPNVRFGAGYSIYCSAAAQAAHDNMTTQFNWDIADSDACSPQLNIISKNRVFTDENQLFATQVMTTDPDFDEVTYAILGGEDQSLFSIDSDTGIISFINVPDFESPHDGNTDNYYHIEITATDNSPSQEMDSQALTIIVRNVFENLSNDHFVTTWDTEIEGSINTNNSSITIPVSYDENSYYNVDWNNDGVFDEFGITESITHDFGTPGIKTIRISGGLPALYFKDNYDSTKLISIDQWGTSPWQSMAYAFTNTSNLINNATDIPNLTECEVLSYAFSGASKIGDQSETSNWDWDVANIKLINNTFEDASVFNQDIAQWDVFQAISLKSLFWLASLFNQDIGLWDVSNVSNLNRTFAGAAKFNQDISQWDTSKVTDMTFLFGGAKAFNQDIGQWNTRKVLDMSYLFYGAESFNQDIGQWNVESVFKDGENGENDDTGFKRMLTGTNQSIINYDALLVGWSNQNLFQNHYFFAGDSIYCSPEARIAHDILTTDYNWTIFDGGQCADTLDILTYAYQALEENTSFVVQIESSDLDYDVVTYSLDNGDDSVFFSINPDSGVLSFNNPPDFELPMDADNDNLYMVQVRATDDGFPQETFSKLMSIEVSNIFEGLDSEFFITTWDTELPGDSNNTSISLLASSNHDYHVDWNNDGIIDQYNITSNVVHDFGTPGIKTIRITGTYPTFNTNDIKKIISIDQWGATPWVGLNFYSASNLVNKASDIPNLAYCDSLYSSFRNASLIGSNTDTGNWKWKTGNIKSMSRMFYKASAFNKDIGSWYTGQVTNMTGMFEDAYSFNQNIGLWDTSGVTQMGYMFSNAYLFNQDLRGWNTTNNKTYDLMFINAISFDQNIGTWNVEKGSSFNYMFSGARLSINNYDALLVGWNTHQLFNNITFNSGNSIYCSQAAQLAHENIATTFNWNIQDAGVCVPELAIVSDGEISMDENNMIVVKILVSDPDFDTAIFSISGGNDMTLFQVDGITGMLSFINSPDFENPNSSENSNTYQVEVTAVDNGTPQETANQLITVNVNDLIETEPVDLIVQISSDTQYIKLGDTFQITIGIINVGFNNVTNAQFFDVLPSGVVHSTWICNATGTASCTASGTGEIFDFIDLPNDSSTITYKVNATASTAFNYQVFSHTSEPQYDTDLSNNSDSVLFFDTIFDNGFEAP